MIFVLILLALIFLKQLASPARIETPVIFHSNGVSTDKLLLYKLERVLTKYEALRFLRHYWFSPRKMPLLSRKQNQLSSRTTSSLPTFQGPTIGPTPVPISTNTTPLYWPRTKPSYLNYSLPSLNKLSMYLPVNHRILSKFTFPMSLNKSNPKKLPKLCANTINSLGKNLMNWRNFHIKAELGKNSARKNPRKWMWKERPNLWNKLSVGKNRTRRKQRKPKLDHRSRLIIEWNDVG